MQSARTAPTRWTKKRFHYPPFLMFLFSAATLDDDTILAYMHKLVSSSPFVPKQRSFSCTASKSIISSLGSSMIAKTKQMRK